MTTGGGGAISVGAGAAGVATVVVVTVVSLITLVALGVMIVVLLTTVPRLVAGRFLAWTTFFASYFSRD